ncbi:hypothetical protein MAQA_15526 [Listeria aquatica FSL S10-1188]|uniref:Uncharacterized protein n=1 Tax=Listeria aquatica FSL S10-1188 TaxID=1265818 RepID=W7B1S1_9LIST|nr:hypothetical protein MAQA_15526 [Listeria aquatica FSL S10-1188]
MSKAIHQKNWEEPIAAAGAADSTTKITQTAMRTASNKRKLFLFQKKTLPLLSGKKEKLLLPGWLFSYTQST